MKAIFVLCFFCYLLSIKPYYCVAQSSNVLQNNLYIRGGVTRSYHEINPDRFNYKQFRDKSNSTEQYIEIGDDLFWSRHMGIGLGLRQNAYTYYVKTQPFTLPLFENCYAEFWYRYWNVALPINFLYKVYNQNGSNFRLNVGVGPSVRFLWTSIEHKSLYAPNNIQGFLLGMSSNTYISFDAKYGVDVFSGIAYYFPTKRRLNFAIGIDVQKKTVKVPLMAAIASVYNVDTDEFEVAITPVDAGNSPLFLNFYVQIGLKNKNMLPIK